MRLDMNPTFANFASQIFNGDHFGIVAQNRNSIHLVMDSNENDFYFYRNEDEYEVTYRFSYRDADGYQNDLYIDDCSDEFETAQDLAVTFGFVAPDFDDEEEIY